MTDDFRPPNEVAESENQVDSLVDNDVGAVSVKGNATEKSFREKYPKFFSRGLTLWPSSSQHKIIGSSIAAAILVLGSGGIYALKKSFKPEPQTEPVSTIKNVPKPATSKLTGVEVDDKVNDLRVIAIMIENSPDARPQAALRDSGVVFEAIAEGGITRFLTLHLEDNPNYIGPVRSVRPYYAEWAAGFDAAIAHAGGSADGLAMVRRLKMSDMDYTIAGGAFRRVGDRFAPHNLYTSMQGLRAEAKRLKYERPSKFEGFARKTEPKNLSKVKPKVANINFSISGGLYDARFAYDAKSNSYLRFMAGQPHRDHKTGKQIQPKVVIALVTSYRQNGIYSVYGTTGTGQIIVFQDGKAEKGTWKRTSPKASLQFFNAAGKPLKLNPGQTWITALKNAGQAKYGP